MAHIKMGMESQMMVHKSESIPKTRVWLGVARRVDATAATLDHDQPCLTPSKLSFSPSFPKRDKMNASNGNL